MKSLAVRIRYIVREHELTTRGVSVSDQEVSAELQRQWNAGMGSAIEEFRPQNKALLEAFAEVYDKKQDPDDVYRRKLKGLMQLDAWESNLILMRSPERRRQLEAEVQSNEAAMEAHKPAIRYELRCRKLAQLIDHELAETDDRYRTALAEIDDLATPPERAREAHGYVRLRREGWWVERIRIANVQILGQEFHDVLRELRLTDPPVSRPSAQ
jgi:hypothetical protein